MSRSQIIIFSILFITLISCDNKEQIEESKKESINQTENIEELKLDYERSIESLSDEIEQITREKSNIEEDAKYSEAQIFSILKESFLDHIIIGTKNLSLSKKLLSNKLGFSTKNGSLHNNGIENFFVEFEDSTEIEVVAVNSANDKIAEVYKSKIEGKAYGLQLALRTSQLKELSRHLARLNNDYNELIENENYSILSKSRFDETLPIFFIDYKQQNNNTTTDHMNLTAGISSVWFSTKKLKDTIYNLVDMGFDLIDTLKIRGISNKAVAMKNNNFEIILIEDNQYKISGVTIKARDLNNIKKRLNTSNLKFDEYTNKRGNNILLKPETTESIWIEFNKF